MAKTVGTSRYLPAEITVAVMALRHGRSVSSVATELGRTEPACFGR